MWDFCVDFWNELRTDFRDDFWDDFWNYSWDDFRDDFWDDFWDDSWDALDTFWSILGHFTPLYITLLDIGHVSCKGFRHVLPSNTSKFHA